MPALLLLVLAADPPADQADPSADQDVSGLEPDVPTDTAPAIVRARWCFREGIHWSPPAPWRVAQAADQDRHLLDEIQADILDIYGAKRAVPVDCIAVRGDFDADGRADLAVMTVNRKDRRAALWLVLSTPSPISEKPILTFPIAPPESESIIASPILLKPKGKNPSQETWNAPESLIRTDALDLWWGNGKGNDKDYFTRSTEGETYFYVVDGSLRKVDVSDS